jgi:hypothetical protein
VAQAKLPTYRTAARVLEEEKGSGLALLGWSVARTFLIAPPMMIVGVGARQAFAGAALASGLISTFTLLRLFNAKQTGMAGLKGAPRARRALRR